jgi:hypothetical protein
MLKVPPDTFQQAKALFANCFHCQFLSPEMRPFRNFLSNLSGISLGDALRILTLPDVHNFEDIFLGKVI